MVAIGRHADSRVGSDAGETGGSVQRGLQADVHDVIRAIGGLQHNPDADVVCRSDIHLVADADLGTVVVCDSSCHQQAVRAAV